jgi:hypothetical protein
LRRRLGVFRVDGVGGVSRLAAVSLAVGISCFLVDSLFYGELTLVPLNFFIVNVYQNLGDWLF